jgi:homoserine O-acetyltransferase
VILGIDSDALFTLNEQQELHEMIPQSDFRVIQSHEGHDGFLIEFEQMNACLIAWFAKILPNELQRDFLSSVAQSTSFVTNTVEQSSLFGESEAAAPPNLLPSESVVDLMKW